MALGSVAVGGDGGGARRGMAALKKETRSSAPTARDALSWGAGEDGDGRERRGEEGKGREAKERKGKGRTLIIPHLPVNVLRLAADMREIEDDLIPARSPPFESPCPHLPFLVLASPPLCLHPPVSLLLLHLLLTLHPPLLHVLPSLSLSLTPTPLQPPRHHPPHPPPLPHLLAPSPAAAPPQPRRIDAIHDPDALALQIRNALGRVWVLSADVGLAVEGGGEDVAAAVVGVQGVREGEVAFADEEDAVVRVEGDGWASVLLVLVLLVLLVGFGLGVRLGSGLDFAFFGSGLGFGSHRCGGG